MFAGAGEGGVGLAMVGRGGGGGFQSAVRREREGRLDDGELGCVRVVAINAVIALAGAAGEVPVTAHAAVGTVGVIPVLGAMALSAEAHGFREWDAAAIREPKLIVVRRVVAAEAGQGAVLVLEALMELVEFSGLTGVGSGRRGGVAGAAGDGDGMSLGIEFAGRDAGLPDRQSDGDRVSADGSRWDPWRRRRSSRE
jgi:hypothetical protein